MSAPGPAAPGVRAHVEGPESSMKALARLFSGHSTTVEKVDDQWTLTSPELDAVEPDAVAVDERATELLRRLNGIARAEDAESGPSATRTGTLFPKGRNPGRSSRSSSAMPSPFSTSRPPSSRWAQREGSHSHRRVLTTWPLRPVPPCSMTCWTSWAVPISSTASTCGRSSNWSVTTSAEKRAPRDPRRHSGRVGQLQCRNPRPVRQRPCRPTPDPVA